MTHQWFWKTQGDLYGPLSTEELEDLFRRDRIADADQIRLGETEDWIPASEVQAMFAAPAEAPADSSGSEMPSQAAARILSQANRLQLNRSDEAPSQGKVLANWLGTGSRGVFEVVAGIRDRLLEGLEWLARFLGRKAILAGMAILLLAFVFKDFQFANSRNLETHQQLLGAWEELQSLQKSKAPESEWQEFEQETMTWLGPLVADLKKSSAGTIFGWEIWSSSSLYTQRELLFAGGNLQLMLQPPRGGETRQQREFTSHLSTANDYLTGKLSYREVLARQQEIMDRLPRRDKQQEDTDGPLLAGFVMLDTVVVAGALVFWWRRRR